MDERERVVMNMEMADEPAAGRPSPIKHVDIEGDVLATIT